LVFILFPVVARLAAVAGGERALGGASLALLAVVIGASVVALLSDQLRLRFDMLAQRVAAARGG
jgi:hypothetical protein